MQFVLEIMTRDDLMNKRKYRKNVLNIATSTAGTIPLQSYYLYQQGMQVGSGMGLMILQYVFHKTTVFLYVAVMILL